MSNMQQFFMDEDIAQALKDNGFVCNLRMDGIFNPTRIPPYNYRQNKDMGVEL